ncbi:MAG TPA: hypothetical protein DC047_11055 [Blastocatellia bacterium]|nr:hypothetical protein [Blastocatellia bacterium]
MTFDFLESYGKRLDSWDGTPMGNRVVAFFIYDNQGQYLGIGFIGGHYISQPFDHLPTREEVEKHFETDERFTKHFN